VLLADTAAMLPGQPDGLSVDDIDRLRARGSEFKALCRELSRVPHSTIDSSTGIFWTSNVIVDAAGGAGRLALSSIGRMRALSHPFFSLLPLLQGIEWNERLAGVPDAAARVARRVPRAMGRGSQHGCSCCTLFELSQTLSALHHAVSYWRLLPSIGAQWWLAAPWCRFFLKACRHSARDGLTAALCASYLASGRYQAWMRRNSMAVREVRDVCKLRSRQGKPGPQSGVDTGPISADTSSRSKKKAFVASEAGSTASLQKWVFMPGAIYSLAEIGLSIQGMIDTPPAG